jgi:hypothetical protein
MPSAINQFPRLNLPVHNINKIVYYTKFAATIEALISAIIEVRCDDYDMAS